MYTCNIGVDVYNYRRQQGGEEVVELKVEDIVQTVIVTVVSDVISTMVTKAIEGRAAPKPKSQPKHLRDKEATK